MEKLLEVLPPDKIGVAKEVFAALAEQEKSMKHLINHDCVQYVNNEYNFKENDILIVSFPKTGQCK